MGYPDWKTIDFRPDAGWKAVYWGAYEFTDGTGYITEPVAGWLIQESEFEERRRIVAAVESETPGELYAATDTSNFWYLIAPGGSDPTVQAVAGKLAHEARRSA